MVSLLGVLSGVAFSFLLQRVGKSWDLWLGEKNIADDKRKYKLEKYWLAFARQSWACLYQRAAVLTEKVLGEIFGKNPFSAGSIFKFSLFSLFLNFILAIMPVIFSNKLLVSNAGHLALWIKVSAVFILINVILDCLAYLLTRFLLRRPLNSIKSMIVSFLLILIVGWLVATVSLVVGSAMAIMPLIDDPFSKGTLIDVLLPLMRAWFFGQFLSPFHSNVEMQGVNMGYIALGAMPSLFLLISALLLAIVLRMTAVRLHFILSKYLGRVLDEKKSFYEHLGFIASLVLILLYWVFFCFLWLLGF